MEARGINVFFQCCGVINDDVKAFNSLHLYFKSRNEEFKYPVLRLYLSRLTLIKRQRMGKEFLGNIAQDQKMFVLLKELSFLPQIQLLESLYLCNLTM